MSQEPNIVKLLDVLEKCKKLNIRIDISQADGNLEEFEKYFDINISDGYAIIIRKTTTPDIFNTTSVIIERNSYVVIYQTYKENKKVWMIDAFNKSYINAYGDFLITFHNNSRGEIYNSVKAFCLENSYVAAYDSSSVHARHSTEVILYNKSTGEITNGASVRCLDDSTAHVFEYVKAECWRYSKVYAYGKTTVTAYGTSKVFAYDNAVVMGHDKSKLVVSGFSTVYKKSTLLNITKSGHFGAIIDNSVFTLEEDLLVYKKLSDDKIATLKLVKGQIFQSEQLDKCRTDRAIVVKIENIDGTENFTSGHSMYKSDFVYVVGETVSTVYNKNLLECSSGIHFFLSRKAAERY